ncbi:hypothetical protein K503DRAFT_800490 [Rhizopogon vinicolor AM-OR11-026]|uniref:Uncharacterized protein n=1 Tax=Rhizopogon vinicolor AM-OR11-026 TaxID=1314800 RepID=A0A1B7N0J0_9AGAM|nr:hypothetical protein K503DRAFT_800490 [Rhizopogon vinicolor AM-OR11-026]
MDENRPTAGSSLTTGLDDLASYLEKSSEVVQEYTDIIEHNYARPALDQMSEYFQALPTMTWFTATLILFTAMSILPVMSFIGISVFVVCGSMFLALMFVFVVIAVVETVFATVLLLALGVILLFSFVLTTAGAMAYLVFRLGQHLQTHGRSGITEWVQETRQHFTSAKPVVDNGDSDTFGVLVACGTNGKTKIEDGSPSRGL